MSRGHFEGIFRLDKMVHKVCLALVSWPWPTSLYRLLFLRSYILLLNFARSLRIFVSKVEWPQQNFPPGDSMSFLAPLSLLLLLLLLLLTSLTTITSNLHRLPPKSPVLRSDQVTRQDPLILSVYMLGWKATSISWFKVSILFPSYGSLNHPK